MKLSSKEWTIIFIELLIAVSIWLLSSNFDFSSIFNSVVGLLLLIIVVAVVVASIFGIIYKRIGEIDKAVEKQENKQGELEEKLKRTEQLIDIKADVKDLQRRIEKLENGKKN